jgi:Raf kinase inhibitor-like YbhB/YbcL family protein
MALEISSPNIADNGEIPKQYTCDAKDVSPPLEWTGIPDNTKSLVLIVDDPDAPDPAAPKMTWVHWILYNIPPTTNKLQENINAKNLPEGTKAGLNDWKRTGYGGPCPPIGRHRYFHKLYALDTVLSDLDTPTKQQLEAEMKGHIIGQAQLVGTYSRA